MIHPGGRGSDTSSFGGWESVKSIRRSRFGTLDHVANDAKLPHQTHHWSARGDFSKEYGLEDPHLES